jgi:hypothetical protein
MTHKILIPRLALVIAAALAGSVHCGGPNAPSPTGLTISGNLSIVAIGKTSQLTATLRKSDGSSQNVTNDSEWSSDNTSVATISSTGVLTAVGFGTTKVTARYGQKQALGGVDSLSATKQAQVVEPAVTSIFLTGNLSFTAVGQTSQLTLTAILTDGSTADVTSVAAWVFSDVSVASIQPSGLLASSRLGVTFLTATYKTRSVFATVVVTPPGTIATAGRARLPGSGEGEGLGVAGFNIIDARSGQTATTDAQGHYTMGGLTSGTHLAFSRDDYEPAELVVTNTAGDVAVQKVVRISAGDTVQSMTAPNDVSYSLSPNGICINCRLIRVNIPASGTLHLSLSWNVANVAESLWINGQLFRGTSPGPLTVDVAVQPGELVVYAGMTNRTGGYVTLKLATSLALPDPLLR